MPPKVVQKKQGDAEDFSDLATLPHANIFKFTVVPKTFFSQENRDKITKRIQENLVPTSLDKIKMLTRDDITKYGKEKNIILDATALAALAPDDPRRQISDTDMMARAAADRLFEMSVFIRRAKKEKLIKLEEEATAKPTDDPSATTAASEREGVDAMIYMLDYPQTKAEAFALARHSYALNGVFEINEVPKTDAEDIEDDESGEDDDEESDEEFQEMKKKKEVGEIKQEVTADNEKTRAEMQKIVDQFHIARSLSAANSPLRQLAFMKVNFKDEPRTTETKESDGQVHQKVRAAEDAFLQEFISFHVDKYAQYFVQYLKFRELVTAVPLVPDRKALDAIKQLQKDGERQAAFFEEQEAQFEEEIKELYEGGDDHADVEKGVEEIKKRAEKLRKEIKERAEDRQKNLKILRKREKVSLDDEKDNSKFKLDVYKNDFVDNAETANNIQSVLSAMITQIESDNSWVLSNSQEKDHGFDASQAQADDATTQAESLDDLFEEFHHEIHCGLKLKDKGPDPVKEKSLAETLSTRHNRGIQIDEENDKTLEVKQTIPLSLIEKESSRLEQISEREREVLKNLNLPGKDRHLMPAIPTKSGRVRDAENPGFYPFCTLPITDAERMLLLKQFQQLIKQNFIDQGAKAEKRAQKDRVFNRTYENHMKPEIFKQVFSEALLDEPDMASLYYPRQDALLLALYNKTSKKMPQVTGGGKSQQIPAVDPNEPDGERGWRAAYRVMPDFQNWITFFADEIVFEQEVAVPIHEPEPVETKPAGKDAKKVNEPVAEATPAHHLTVNIMKYSMDEELLPERMLDIEDDKVQNIAEKSALLYPDDNSIMRVDHFTVGGKTFSKSIVVKDNLKFGLRQRDQRNDEVKQQIQVRRAADPINHDSDTSEGLVQYRMIGDTEFWLNFENGTKMGVEQVQMKRLPYKILRTDPDPPSAEEIAKREEAMRAQLAALAKQKTVKGQAPPPEIEIPKTPEPTFMEKELNHLDTLFSDRMLKATQSMATLTLKNGLIVQLLGSGEVCQIHDTELSSEGKDGFSEANRLITKDGVVIRQLHNRDAEVLYPDGVVAYFSKKNMEWIVTNNKGKRRSYKDNFNKDLAPIPCATETDAVTKARMMIREDNLCTVTYQDGSLFVQHADGTQMHTSADGKEIRIEKTGYGQHTIRISDGMGERPMSQPALKSVQQRALDKNVLETYLPDGSMVQTFLDIVPTKLNAQSQMIRHVIKRSDLSVIIVDSEGHISVISSNARAALNEAGGKARLDYEEKDVDYLAELARGHGQFINSVYQGHVSAKPNKSTIKIKNSQNNIVFTLKSDHTLSKHLTTVEQIFNKLLSPKNNKDADMGLLKKGQKRPAIKEPSAAQPGMVGDLEIENVGGWQNPHTKYYQYPRLFVIHKDGSAKELLSVPQLDYGMRKKKIQIDQTIKQKMSDVFNNSSLANHYYLTKVINMKQRELEQQKLIDLEFPENAQEVLRNKIQTPDLTLEIPKQEQYLYTQIFQLPDCDELAQQIFLRDYQNYLEWKMSQLRYDTEFAIVHLPVSKDQPVDWNQIADQEYANKRICQRILKHRAQPGAIFVADDFKQSAVKSMASSGEIAEYRKKISNRLDSQRSSRSKDKTDRSKPNSQGGSKRGDPMRQSNQKSTMSGDVMSEDENDLQEDVMIGLTEKEKLERKKERERREIVKAKLKPDRVEQRNIQINQILEDRDAIKNTPEFVDRFFQSDAGQKFLQKNPPIEPSQEVIIRMRQRIERKVKQGTDHGNGVDGDNGNGQHGSNSIEGVSNQRSNDLVMVGEGMDDKDNPIVALEPDNLKQGSAFMGSKMAGKMNGAGEASMEGDKTITGDQTLPSLYMQEKMYLYNKEQELLLKAEEHHIVKTKDFNVYGRLRDEQLKVKSMAKSSAVSELNEKFITTECITDRRIKISSMAPRFYMKAPSVEDVRKQGQHQMILSAINKKQTFAELINQANSMVTGVLHDSMKRSLNIMPSQVFFGGLRAGSTNDFTITIKNEDMIGHRVTIKPIQDQRILVKQEEYGMIAPGMIKKLIVTIRVPDDAEVPANIKETLTIVSKHDIFKLPITAKLLSEADWEKDNKNNMATTGRPIQNSRVRERLNRALAQSRGSERGSDEPRLLTKKPRGQGESLRSGSNDEYNYIAQKSSGSGGGDLTDPSQM